MKVFQESFFPLTKPSKKNKFAPSRLEGANFKHLIAENHQTVGFETHSRNKSDPRQIFIFIKKFG
jgi:hypothetical protein